MDQVETWGAADLLERTADVIEERGHAKHVLIDCDGAICLMGGMNFALSGYASDFGAETVHNLPPDSTRQLAHRALFDYLGLRMTVTEPVIDAQETRTVALVRWNNETEREPSEVIDACRHAAKALRGG